MNAVLHVDAVRKQLMLSLNNSEWKDMRQQSKRYMYIYTTYWNELVH